MTKKGICFTIVVTVGMSVAVASASRRPAPQNRAQALGTEFFGKKVAPILQKNCLTCHNGEKRRGGLDLSRQKTMMKGGSHGPVVIPGNSRQSLLMKMVQGPTPKMPQRGDALSPKQIQALARWIDGGAPWPDGVELTAESTATEAWWSFRPLVRSPLPKVRDADWPRTPIDTFILAALEAKGMRPSPEVDRTTFIRRVTYDLHGLPPTPQEIQDFVNDRSPDAYERLIDRLLASPRYGERWARHWMDIVHYADTHGFDKDKRRLWAWLYRDWLIRAFNRDMPYSRFVRQQLAGDVLNPSDPDGIIATGFVVAGPWDFVGHVELREGTVAKAKTRVLDRDDMVANTMSTFASMTVHCARCHDHKFDPISQLDYYRLQAVFAGVERGDRLYSSPETQQKVLVLQKQRKFLQAEQAEIKRQIEQIKSPKLRELEKEIATLDKQIAKLPPIKWTGKSPTNGYHSGISKTHDVVRWVQIDLGRPMPIDEIRLLPARPTDFPDSPGFGFPKRFRVDISDDASFAKCETLVDYSQIDYRNPGDTPVFIPCGKTARYIRMTAFRLWERRRDYVFALAEMQVESGGRNVAVGKKVTALDSIEAGRWSRRHLVDQFTSRHKLPDLSSLQLPPVNRTRIDLIRKRNAKRFERDRLARTLVDAALRSALRKTEMQIKSLDQGIASVKKSNKVYGVVPRDPRPIHVLHRGDVTRKKDLVVPGTLSMLPGLPSRFELADPKKEGERRKALADWIVAKNNVLTWRSIVNRVWHYHFGRGIVDTPNDFGQNGSQPTHPKLLDWLAAEFRDNGQSFKKLHRMILLSAAYRQSAHHNGKYAKIDGGNRLLWRMNRRRLDAESIRDSVLYVSGQLRDKMYGPGYALFKFKDDHSPHYDHTDVTKINDPQNFRRTVYRFIVRSVPNPFLESLDCADPNISVPVRNKTLTALQALSLLNNPFMVKQSQYFAARLKAEESDLERQVALAFQLAFGRSPSDAERTAVADYVQRHGLANACRWLLNANEFMFVD